ncbi:MAG: RNA methyltransferase [Thermoprotei archaeon]|jgi:TrmH family RNA methyltransferase
MDRQEVDLTMSIIQINKSHKRARSLMGSMLDKESRYTEMIRIVVVEPIYEFNIGMIARAMKNFGFNNLYLVNPKSLSEEARKYASHAADILENAKVVKTLNDALKDVDLSIATTGVIGGDYNVLRIAVPIQELSNLINYHGSIALVFGREDHGLSNEEIALCDMVATIPTSEEYPVMNLSHAVAVILYELTRNRIRAKKYRLAKRDERKMIEKFFIETLKHTKIQTHKIRTSELVFSRLLSRSFLTGREAYTLIGCFRKIHDLVTECSSKENLTT